MTKTEQNGENDDELRQIAMKTDPCEWGKIAFK